MDEQNKQPENGPPKPQSNGGVMDIAPPSKPAGPTPPASVPVANSDVKPPDTPAPAAAPGPIKKGLSPELIAQAQKESGLTATGEDKGKAPKASHKGQPRMAIVFAIVIAIALAGLTVYVYMSTQKKDDSKNDQNTTETQTTETTQAADEASVDEASKEVDEAIKSTEETQLTEQSVSDQSLGL